jgi:hypothetical protein
MIHTTPKPALEEVDWESLTANELGLLIQTPRPGDTLLEIEEHLRELALCSGK